jgi:hypothetical protein
VQRGTFRLLSDHLIQKGPSFKHPLDASIDASTGQITVRYKEDAGKEKVLTQRLELPPDVANGLLFTLLKDIKPTVPQTKLSMVATTPKPQLVKLAILPEGRGTVLDREFSLQSHALRCESGNRRFRWVAGASNRQGSAGHARMGSRR